MKTPFQEYGIVACSNRWAHGNANKTNLPAITFGVSLTGEGVGVLLNYQLAMNLLLRKVSNRHILKPRPLKDKLFAQVCSIGKFCKIFQITAILDQSLIIVKSLRT